MSDRHRHCNSRVRHCQGPSQTLRRSPDKTILLSCERLTSYSLETGRGLQKRLRKAVSNAPMSGTHPPLVCDLSLFFFPHSKSFFVLSSLSAEVTFLAHINLISLYFSCYLKTLIAFIFPHAPGSNWSQSEAMSSNLHLCRDIFYFFYISLVELGSTGLSFG